MALDDFIYRTQDVNYLGFLEAQLRDLQGIDTLAYELIQNADDVQLAETSNRPSWIAFDLTDEAMVVANDGVFRHVDFERMQDLAGGGKRDEAGTTGAFGIGFLAVYQVTDRPEILSGGRHWIVRPEAEPAQRILERQTETTGTQLRLPWAFDERSVVRRALRLPVIKAEQLDELTVAIAEAIELAALFLRQLRRLEVRRNGVLVRRIERELPGGGALYLTGETGQVSRWLLLEGDFAANAEELRERHRWQIEDKRESIVYVSLPLTEVQRQGRLFAGLPSETTTPLPFHINADFFPTTDRKRIHLDDGYQAAWNEAALTAAAALIAANLGRLRQAVEPASLWQMLAQVAETRRMARQGDLPSIFAAFWDELARLLPREPVVYTLQGEWRRPAETRLWERPLTDAMGSVLAGLQLPIVHPDLAPYFRLMRQPEVGTPPLVADDIATALLRAGLAQSVPLTAAPAFLRSLDSLQALWQLIDPLVAVAPEARGQALAALTPCAIVLTGRMELEQLDRVYRGDAEARALFPDIPWLHELAPEDAFPGRWVPTFGVRQAVELLSERPLEELETDWRLGRLDLPRLFRWFESHQIEIFGDDPSLTGAIRRLPLGPVAGELRPLAELYTPGGFTDPLGVAGIVELEQLGGRREFLWDLGMEELHFETYLHEQMPRALLQNPDLPSDARHRLLQLLAERLGEFRDDEELQEKLSELPLIPAMDGSFRAGRVLYSDRESRDLLGERAHIAEPATNKAIAALQRWLGVRAQPDAPELVAALIQIGDEAAVQPSVDKATDERARKIWRKLAQLLAEGQAMAATLSPLRERPVFPDARGQWRRPEQLLFADDPQLASQVPAIAGRLLAAGDDAALALAAAGVRPLSGAVELQLVAQGAVAAVPALQQRLSERAPLISRILHAEVERAERVAALALLDRLQVRTGEVLAVQWRLSLGDEQMTSKPETVTAGLDQLAGVLYVGAGGPVPWLAVGRELARAFTGERHAGGLAIAMRDVLAAETFDEAARILDELDYPPL